MPSKSAPKSSVFRTSLAEQVSGALLEFIRDNSLLDGDPLPSTGELAEQFGVSRTVVREALADLAGRGVLVRSQGRESVVRTPGTDELHQLLSLRVWRDKLEVQNIQMVREPLEVLAAGLAAEHRSDDQLKTMAEHLATQAAARRDAVYHEADVAFHRSVAEASGNQLLALILDSLAPLLLELRIRATAGRRASGQTLEPVIEAHRKILRKIESADREGARKAMAAHLSQTWEGIEIALEVPRPKKRSRSA